MSTIQSRRPEKEAKKPRDIDLKISMKILFHCPPTFPKILKAFLKTLPTKMKPTKCPAREKKNEARKVKKEERTESEK